MKPEASNDVRCLGMHPECKPGCGKHGATVSALEANLQELARISQEMGGYDAPVKYAAPEEKSESCKPTNPKDLIGSDKLPLHLWPQVASALGSLALLDGALKYGRSNFRAIGVRASIYKDALDRHMGAWFEGEDNDPDSGLPHLAHALACLAILADAQAAGKLNDDRQYPGGHRAAVDALTPHVARIKAKHAGKTVQHYMKGDGE